MEDFAVNVSDLRLQLKCARANVAAIQLAMAEQAVDKMFSDALYAASEHLEMLTERLDAIRNEELKRRRSERGREADTRGREGIPGESEM